MTESRKNNKTNFKKGAVEMLTLQLLSAEGECYGYQLTQLLEQVSDGAIVVPEGSLYPILYKLIDNGFIIKEERLVSKRQTRIYYQLTVTGKQRLNELIFDYNAVNCGIQKILNYKKEVANEPAEN